MEIWNRIGKWASANDPSNHGRPFRIFLLTFWSEPRTSALQKKKEKRKETDFFLGLGSCSSFDV